MSLEEDYKIATPEKKNFKFQLECVNCETICSSHAKFKTHEKRCLKKRTCKICSIVFEDADKLISHRVNTHGHKSTQNYSCNVCDKTFKGYKRYTYHNRSVHYNLIGTTDLFVTKKVNDVWYERVRNTDTVVEMHKTKPNALIIKRYTGEEKVKIEENTKVEDLTDLYPTIPKPRETECKICEKVVLKKLYKKHVEEIHKDFTNFECNDCKATFKRLYWFKKHNCQIVNVKTESVKPNTE